MPFDAEAPATTIKAQLERAKDAIRQHGHTKYTPQDELGRVCTAQAIQLGIIANGQSLSLGARTWDQAAHRAVITQLDREGQFANICVWNNQPETTADDVIALFDRTIASL